MSSVLALARAELLELEAYQPGQAGNEDGSLVRLHANESPWRPIGDDSRAGLNRYPDPQPPELVARLAELYGVDENRVLLARGSDEAIDLLVRGFCRAGADGVFILPPTFGQYRTSAKIHGAKIHELALERARGFEPDEQALYELLRPEIKLLFLCSPNNPTGGSLDRSFVERACERLAGRALVVLDEAYVEFARTPSLVPLMEDFSNLVVLRTLSKAHALAGARCGALIGDPDLVSFLRRLLQPFALTSLTVEAALRALAPESLRTTGERVRVLLEERERLRRGLAGSALVKRVFPSEANFLLVESHDAERFLRASLTGGVMLRWFPRERELEGCVRVTVGTPQQNELLLQSVAQA